MISLVHLSDLHLCKDNEVLLQYTSQIVNIIRNEVSGSQKLFFLISGDIAFSGSIEEYELALSFFSEIQEQLQAFNPEFLFVPGNHDCNFKKDTQMRQSFLKDQHNLVETLSDETQKNLISVQKEFFDLARNHHK